MAAGDQAPSVGEPGGAGDGLLVVQEDAQAPAAGGIPQPQSVLACRVRTCRAVGMVETTPGDASAPVSQLAAVGA